MLSMGVANLAGYVQRQGRLVEADSLHRDALRRYTADVGERHPNTAVVMTNLAYTSYLRGRYDDAEIMYRRAIAILDSAWQGTPGIAQTLADFAVVLREQGECIEGAQHARRAMLLFREASPQRALYPQRILGTCLVKLGSYVAAESLLVAAHTELLRAFGGSHPYTTGTAQDVVQLYEAWGKPEKAQQYRAPPKPAP
jgi:tetratricopeptide (TPR) repeat protein